MHLTAFLMLSKRKAPHGIKYRGKNRVVPKPKMEHLFMLRHRLERDEENMLILRHPYLTSEQSRNYMKDLKVPVPLSIVGNRKRNELFNKHFSWVDQLAHLRVRDAWE
ncbi:uncharacterized protein LOC123258612 [Cotesia glomerata]|uniref:Ribosomal protein 63, mitochondrial n=1 Tax=Cotesia glomerata TaxID=32391 RepID=A0AAV7HXR4_COTGL|nr:uncharacterized protein LOC123258612 [Cotesia glomerata]KAH0539228.1 hypothetical protein KQX54_002415 [Cotesia glomerata]